MVVVLPGGMVVAADEVVVELVGTVVDGGVVVLEVEDEG